MKRFTVETWQVQGDLEDLLEDENSGWSIVIENVRGSGIEHTV